MLSLTTVASAPITARATTAAPATAPRRGRVHTITAIVATTGHGTTTHQHGSRATSDRAGAATEAGNERFPIFVQYGHRKESMMVIRPESSFEAITLQTPSGGFGACRTDQKLLCLQSNGREEWQPLFRR